MKDEMMGIDILDMGIEYKISEVEDELSHLANLEYCIDNNGFMNYAIVHTSDTSTTEASVLRGDDVTSAILSVIRERRFLKDQELTRLRKEFNEI